MSPHLVTNAADEAYRPPESRLGDGDPSNPTGLSAQQASDLLAGHRRSVRRSHSWYWDRRLHTRLAWRQARRHYWAAATERSEAAVERARSTLAATPAARRPYGRIGAFLVTALLMLASFFTITSILASADLAPLEAWLLPVAFGPVFVLATKIAVGAWLSSAPAGSSAVSNPSPHELARRAMSGLRLAGPGWWGGAEERRSRSADAAAERDQSAVIGADLRRPGAGGAGGCRCTGRAAAQTRGASLRCGSRSVPLGGMGSRVRSGAAPGCRQSNRCCRACARRASGVEGGTCPACAGFGLGAGRSSQPEW